MKDVDVAILGAGVNGAGLFRDLCLQGVTCALIDKGDVGGGTSAAPSRLIHGGLKYLETGEFGLVAQSTLERNLLLRNAPHLVKPLPTVIPIFSWAKGVGASLRTLFGSTTAPRSRGALLVKTGLSLYDFYGSRHRVMPRHAMWSRKSALRRIPALTPRIKAAGRYHDALVTAPERLVWELVSDGLAANPDSSLMTYATLAGQTGGVLHVADAEGDHEIRPRIVVNAAGPWIDTVNAALGEETRLIGGTKGSHILLDHPDLVAQLAGRMIYFEADDGRILLVYDYLGRAMVGSTDIPASDPDEVICTESEIDYFLGALKALLPGLDFGREQIVYAYAGIRPLPNSEGTAPGLISRDHSTPELDPTETRPFPVISLVGGKWTTFRGFAEEVADDLLARLGRPRKVSTQETPIGGGRDYPDDPEAWVAEVARETNAAPERVARLLERYGTAARNIAAEPPLGALEGDPGTDLADLAAIARTERTERMADLILRRTTLGVTSRVTAHDLRNIGETVGKALGWSESRIAEEIAATRADLIERHRVRL